MNNDKLVCFEFLMQEFIQWYKETTNNNDLQSFTRLKIHKLLFLTAAVNASVEDKKLLDIFDNFYAMQYGPVESDIYNAMVNNSFSYLSFSNRVLEYKENTTLPSIEESLQNKIQEAIEAIKAENQDLIKYPASKLVDITHKWSSWKYAMEIADIFGKGSEKMTIESICNDEKHFV